MQPPIFIWKSDTLDYCDSQDDFENRYPPSELLDENVVACDSRGRALWISRIKDGAVVNVADESQAESPELLRSILWKYLEGRGTPPEEIRSLSLIEMVRAVCPPDPYPAEKVKAKLLFRLYILLFGLLCIGVMILFDWLRRLH